jgi:hypothetical protein
VDEEAAGAVVPDLAHRPRQPVATEASHQRPHELGLAPVADLHDGMSLRVQVAQRDPEAQHDLVAAVEAAVDRQDRVVGELLDPRGRHPRRVDDDQAEPLVRIQRVGDRADPNFAGQSRRGRVALRERPGHWVLVDLDQGPPGQAGSEQADLAGAAEKLEDRTVRALRCERGGPVALGRGPQPRLQHATVPVDQQVAEGHRFGRRVQRRHGAVVPSRRNLSPANRFR